MTTKQLQYGPVLALLCGATMWGVIWYPLRLLENQGVYGVWLSGCIYIAAFLLALPWLPTHHRTLWKHWRPLTCLALASAGTNIAFVLAVLEGNVLRVLLLFYLNPIWAIVLARIFLGEKFNLIVLFTLVLALSGSTIMLWEPSLGFPWPRNYAEWLAIFAGFAFASSNVITRGTGAMPLMAKCLAAWAGVIIVAAVLILFFKMPVPDFSMPVIGGLFLTGTLGIFVMTLLVLYGVSNMPVQRSAIILLFEIIAGAVSQQLLTYEVVTFKEVMGGLFIAGAAYLSTRPKIRFRRNREGQI